jgi:hypothetical protein
MKRDRIKTWMVESLVVAGILSASILIHPFKLSELICGVAVWITFMHGQVSDRMQEKQSQMSNPDVSCYKWSTRYFLLKEAMWITFFLMIGSYSALVGSLVFFVYPFWRKFYRKLTHE